MEQRISRRHRYGPVTVTLAILLIVYWVSLFTATHVPVPKGLLRNGGDKVAHFLTYAGLATLMLSVRASHGPFGWRSVIWRFLVLAGYGAFDELTQILVRRQADIVDWTADSCGAFAGLALVVCVSRWLRNTNGKDARTMKIEPASAVTGHEPAT